MNGRFDLQPLAALLGATCDSEIAHATDTCRRTVQRWKHDGMSADQADRAAIRAGYHPANIWPDWYSPSPTPEDAPELLEVRIRS